MFQRKQIVRHTVCWILSLSVIAGLMAFVETPNLIADAPTALPKGIVNTQNPGDRPPTPQQALQAITLPEGFSATLFAGEPDVAQPIAMTFDDRGRLWVVECFSYPEWSTVTGSDRVLIFEDVDQDGQFDRRTVFLDNGKNLTGIEWGFGGVWLCSAPNLLFIPDRDGDDRPDGLPQILLDGWNLKDVKHNIFNGLNWGPDGWLYGCHGILGESRVGAPGTPDSERVAMNCGIWRYHPTRKTFEVVAHGTTNPWGVDFDDFGEGYFANCVIEHLWQIVPGGRYQRMFGQDYNPYSYRLLGASSDHFHWEADHWTEARGGKGVQDQLGGGHAHCGTMVYLGDNWPAEYRNHIFMNNIHGARLNQDIPEPNGSGIIARHGADLFRANSEWFRGVALRYGPDGGVYVSDWNDLGECHDDDGVVRDSGRIYRILYGQPGERPVFNLANYSLQQLVDLHLHRNEWFVRAARRVLMQRKAEGIDIRSAEAGLREIAFHAADPARRLRGIWTLAALDRLNAEDLSTLLNDANEHVRSWAVRLVGESEAHRTELLARLEAMASGETSARVRLQLAYMLQRVPVEKRWTMVTALSKHAEDAADPNIPLMLWYAIEPAIAADATRAAALIAESSIPHLREFGSRRMVEADAQGGLQHIVDLLRESDRPVLHQREITFGAMLGLQGHAIQFQPTWKPVLDSLRGSADDLTRRHAARLAMMAGDASVADDLLGWIGDANRPLPERAEAIAILANVKDPRLPDLLKGTLRTTELRAAALQALSAYDRPEIADWILETLENADTDAQRLAVSILTSRPPFASRLLDALQARKIDRQIISTAAARQIQNLNDPALTAKLEATWGRVQVSSQERKDLLYKWRHELTAERLVAADLENGRLVFDRACLSCHTLFNRGGKIGPDLTGSDRRNLDYLLMNMIDPNATVSKDYQLTLIQMDDGRSLTGLILRETDALLTLQTIDQEMNLAKSKIIARNSLPVSMMPEGLLNGMTDQEVRDLVGYLSQ